MKATIVHTPTINTIIYSTNNIVKTLYKTSNILSKSYLIDYIYTPEMNM